MRVNKTVSAVLVTTFAGAVALGGVASGTAFAADEPRPQAGQASPQADAQQLQEQARMLARTADALKPVAELIDAVLEAPENRLSEDEADRHAKAVHEALAPLTQQAEQEQDAPRGAEAELAYPSYVQHDSRSADPAARAAVRLDEQVDELLRVSEAGDQRAVEREVRATVQAAADLVQATGGELSAGEQRAEQQAPQAEQRQAAGAEEGPQLAESQLPPGDAELELLPR